MGEMVETIWVLDRWGMDCVVVNIMDLFSYRTVLYTGPVPFWVLRVSHGMGGTRPQLGQV